MSDRLFDSSTSSSAANSRPHTPVKATTPRASSFSTPSTVNRNFSPISRYPLWRRILISGWFYYSSSILTFVLILTLLHYNLRVSYCGQYEVIDCIHCPPNYVCSGHIAKCAHELKNGICIAPGTDENAANELLEKHPELREMIVTRKVASIEEIKKHGFDSESSKILGIAVKLNQGFTVKNGKIVEQVAKETEVAIVFSALIVSLLITFTSFYFRHRSGI